VAGDSNNNKFYASPATVSAESVAYKIRVQERRIETLERQLAARNRAEGSSYDTVSPPEDYNHCIEPKLGEERMFRGKGFKTMFYGSTSPFSLISQVCFQESNVLVS
jgi:hypothetical protein